MSRHELSPLPGCEGYGGEDTVIADVAAAAARTVADSPRWVAGRVHDLADLVDEVEAVADAAGSRPPNAPPIVVHPPAPAGEAS